jgi:hypothetical protein
MRRTQIQLPEGLYMQLKNIAEKEETSLADIIRRAGEYFISLYPEYKNTHYSWTPPEPEALGPFLTEDSEWRTLAHDQEGI